MRAKDLEALYEAKCRDLVINPTKDQERRFFGFCRRQIADRKILMREQALGPHSAHAISRILARAPGHFSHLDVSRNNLGNAGL